jgi:hypothetical protein
MFSGAGMTAISVVYTKSGFVVAADGKRALRRNS